MRRPSVSTRSGEPRDVATVDQQCSTVLNMRRFERRVAVTVLVLAVIAGAIALRLSTGSATSNRTRPPAGLRVGESGSAAADQSCSDAGQSFADGEAAPGTNPPSLVASHESTAGAVQQWVETRTPGAQPQLTSPADPSAPVAVCFFSGSFTGIPMSPGEVAAGEHYQNVIVTVDETSGGAALNAATIHSTWSFSPPPPS